MTAAPNTPVSNLQRLEALEVLVREQVSRIEKLERVIAGLGAVFGGGGADAATDRELDHPQHGDPEVKLIPRDAVGMGVNKGQRFSRCSADFLEILAESYDFFASKNEASGAKDGKGNPKSVWDRKTARLARGWARRIRCGWTPPPAPPAPSFGGGSAGGGFASGSSRGWGDSGGGGFGTGGGFLGASPPVAPPDPGSGPASAAADDDDFPFGANVGTPPAPPAPAPTTEDDDDDPPLSL